MNNYGVVKQKTNIILRVIKVQTSGKDCLIENPMFGRKVAHIQGAKNFETGVYYCT